MRSIGAFSGKARINRSIPRDYTLSAHIKANCGLSQEKKPAFTHISAKAPGYALSGMSF